MRLSCSGVGGGLAAAELALVDLLGGVLGLSMSAMWSSMIVMVYSKFWCCRSWNVVHEAEAVAFGVINDALRISYPKRDDVAGGGCDSTTTTTGHDNALRVSS